MAVVETLILLAIIVFLLYKWGISTYDYFEKQNIPYEKPIPFLGNMPISQLTGKESVFDNFKKIHLRFNSKIYGIYSMKKSLITLKDPELIKQVFVKDFDHFVNHSDAFAVDDDSFFTRVLFSLKDQKWKDMRSTLSPAFTGNKLRIMFQLISECTTEAIKYLKDESKKNPNGLEMDTKDFFTKFTNDVIASTAFGLKSNSLTDEDSEFYKMSRKAVAFDGTVMLKIFMFNYLKPLAKLLNIKIFNDKFTGYFTRLVIDTMKYRLENNIIRPDMINLLLEARKLARTHQNDPQNQANSHNRDWTDEDMAAQCFLFFIAGFETTASLMCFASQELVANPEIQEKLYEEIADLKEQLNGKQVSYDDLKGMKYMDMVISETLRKWPVAITIDRACNKPYVLEYDDNRVEMKVGDIVWINVIGLHHDPENFENPDVFDPERFSDENKGNIKPFTYAPFGLGPRSCIGLRLALVEVKSILFNVLSEFKFEASEKTVLPISIDPKNMQISAKGGFHLKMVPRK